MKGTVKIVRDSRNGVYNVFCKNYFWQRWKPLIVNGKQLSFKSFKDFSDITKIESFGEIRIRVEKYQGM